ncbi:hypothetical protein [Rhizohabitans arisaemae]|uniref:hypothetical protein n=1 Tax=Rhizohabitans arisaemae TaxID=2720610 RepID=UPI0024B0EF92|nr:hypothetical protein [Rhizohabitans arisaemae]
MRTRIAAVLTTLTLVTAGVTLLGQGTAHAATTCTDQQVPAGLLVTCTGDPATLRTSSTCMRRSGYRYGITRDWPVPGQGIAQCSYGDLMMGGRWWLL